MVSGVIALSRMTNEALNYNAGICIARNWWLARNPTESKTLAWRSHHQPVGIAKHYRNVVFVTAHPWNPTILSISHFSKGDSSSRQNFPLKQEKPINSE